MGNMGGTASTVVAAPIDRCWEAIEDVAAAPRWQEGLTSMEVAERDADGRAVVVDSVNDAKARELKSRLRIEYDAPTRLSWTQEEGDLKRVHGSWQLEEAGEGRTRATYSLEIDPGRMLGMLVRGPAEDKLREMLVEGRPAELKALVEG